MKHSDRHAGLQRVAALLGGDASEAVFAAATEELARVVDPDTGEACNEMAVVSRYEADRVVIASGLGKGDVVVTAGVNQLVEGQAVRLIESAQK